MLNGTKRRSRWAILASRTISLMGRYIFCQTKLNTLLERNCSSMAAGLLRPKSLMPSILLSLRDYIQLGDRKSVVSGKRGSERVNLGGRSFSKKKNEMNR